jgi:hypothetical protein
MRFTADPVTEIRFYDVNAAGDVNGDGYIDWWIMRMTADESTFTFQVYYGGPNADTIPDVVIHPGLSFWRAADDFNGDGFDDLYANYQESPGHGIAYYGGNPMDTIPDLMIHSRPGHRYEAYAWSFGDLNGDRCSDFVSNTPPLSASLTSFWEGLIPIPCLPTRGRGSGALATISFLTSMVIIWLIWSFMAFLSGRFILAAPTYPPLPLF